MIGADGNLGRLVRQFAVFLCVGGAANVLYAGLYLLMRDPLGPQPANAVSLVASTLAGTAGHRRMTFGVRGMSRFVDHQVLGLALLVFGLAVTAGSLWLLHASSAGDETRLAEIAVLVAANASVGVVRFVVLRRAMVPVEEMPRDSNASVEGG